MSFLLDTNIVSELRRGPENCQRNVWRWYDAIPVEDLYLSVLVLGEMRRGIELKRRRDPPTAQVYEHWLREVAMIYRNRILEVTDDIADTWGRLAAKVNLPAIDGLLAATAVHHGLTVATRNTADFQRCGVDYINPFEA